MTHEEKIQLEERLANMENELKETRDILTWFLRSQATVNTTIGEKIAMLEGKDQLQ